MGSYRKRREVRNVVRRFKGDFLILCKTKLVSPSLALLRSIGGERLNKWEILPSQGASGGIIIDWNSAFCVKVDQCLGSFLLSVKLINQVDKLDWWLTGVYGPCAPSLKLDFLAELRHLQTMVSSNWS